jgi:hypothetical protein
MGLDESCIPVSLLALSGFQNPPTRAQVEWTVGILSLLVSSRGELLACRSNVGAEDRYRVDARLQIGDPVREELGGWAAHAVAPTRYSALTDVCLRYWRTHGDHWLFCDWPACPAMHGRVLRCLRNTPHPEHLQGALLRLVDMVAVTFDDILVDILARREPEEVIGIVERCARQYGLSVIREQVV